MKRKLLLSFLLVFGARVFAQSPTFTYSNKQYLPITGGTQIHKDSIWDDLENIEAGTKFKLGFAFDWKGNSFDSIEIFDGYVMFSDSNGDNLVAGCFMDLIDRGYGDALSKSPIFIKHSGVSPNAVFEIEWQNAGYYDELDFASTLDDSVNLKVSVYEANSQIDIHLGNSGYANNPPLYLQEINFGAVETLGNNDYVYITEGNSTAPTLTSDINTVGLTSMPISGQLYTFKFEKTAAAKPVSKINNLYYSNGTVFNAAKSEAIVEIYNMTGQLVQLGNTSNYMFKHKELSSGLYIAQVKNGNGVQKLQFFVP